MKKILSISILLILITSLFFNYRLFNKLKEVKVFEKINSNNDKYFQNNLDLFNTNNDIFKDILIKKDYKKFNENFGYMMQENPVGAYLLSNTFYNLTKDKNIIHKVEASESQLKTIYYPN